MSKTFGSVWRKADFHVHTPYSALLNNYGDDFDNYVQQLYKIAIEKKIHIIGITDYFTIEGYKKIRLEYLAKPEKMKMLFSAQEIEKIKKILVLPNIEFRLNKIIQINKIRDGKKISTEMVGLICTSYFRMRCQLQKLEIILDNIYYKSQS
ncbi:hypothetical protein [Sphingobacterium sp. GVS05A]|uniref:hypothetical protein n=1 Tax=Sphingobacterium sp. GVS05A TaxID=2862679 RepID=UPI001CBF3F64|nr:hypothetical protein [Sphingobacterium sp. GVS05A]